MEKSKNEESEWKEKYLNYKKDEVFNYLRLGILSTVIGGILLGLPLGAIFTLTYTVPSTMVAIRLSDAIFGAMLAIVGIFLVLGGIITLNNKIKEYKAFKE